MGDEEQKQEEQKPRGKHLYQVVTVLDGASKVQFHEHIPLPGHTLPEDVPRFQAIVTAHFPMQMPDGNVRPGMKRVPVPLDGESWDDVWETGLQQIDAKRDAITEDVRRMIAEDMKEEHERLKTAHEAAMKPKLVDPTGQTLGKKPRLQ